MLNFCCTAFVDAGDNTVGLILQQYMQYVHFSFSFETSELKIRPSGMCMFCCRNNVIHCTVFMTAARESRIKVALFVEHN